MTIHFTDGSTASNSNWQSATPLDANYISILGGGAVVVGLVPTDMVKYIDFLS